MAKSFRKNYRFDAISIVNLNDLYEKENKISKETGGKKISENQIIMEALALLHKVKCEGDQLKKETSEERRFYAQMNDKIISKYFNALMDCLEGVVNLMQDQELYLGLLSVKNDVTYLLESMGEEKLLNEMETEKRKLSGLKHRYERKRNEELIF